jgi:hypothetical protein
MRAAEVYDSVHYINSKTLVYYQTQKRKDDFIGLESEMSEK